MTFRSPSKALCHDLVRYNRSKQRLMEKGGIDEAHPSRDFGGIRPGSL